MTKDIQIDSQDWPRCAKCDMPVENFRARQESSSITFVAECHGETEVVTVPDEVWVTMYGTHVNLGQAFDNERNKL